MPRQSREGRAIAVSSRTQGIKGTRTRLGPYMQRSPCLSSCPAGSASGRTFRQKLTMIHSGTLCIQRKATKFPCFGGLVFRAQFQHFLSAFWRSFFPVQLALVSMSTITPTLFLSVFSLQTTRLFRTCRELWRTRGELWLYFEMQRRLDLWSFSWSSRRSREAQKGAQLAFRDRSIDDRTDPRR